jgi:hypothetical protein
MKFQEAYSLCEQSKEYRVKTANRKSLGRLLQKMKILISSITQPEIGEDGYQNIPPMSNYILPTFGSLMALLVV